MSVKRRVAAGGEIAVDQWPVAGCDRGALRIAASGALLWERSGAGPQAVTPIAIAAPTKPHTCRMTILPASRAFSLAAYDTPAPARTSLRELLTSALRPEMVLVATVLGILDEHLRSKSVVRRRPRSIEARTRVGLGPRAGCQSPRCLGGSSDEIKIIALGSLGVTLVLAACSPSVRHRQSEKTRRGLRRSGAWQQARTEWGDPDIRACGRSSSDQHAVRVR